MFGFWLMHFEHLPYFDALTRKKSGVVKVASLCVGGPLSIFDNGKDSRKLACAH